MTEVLVHHQQQQQQQQVRSFTPDQSESEDYVNALHSYVSDTDTDGYSGNPASPLARISIRECCNLDPEPQLARGRWGDVGRASCLTRRTSSFNRGNEGEDQERERSAQLSLVALLLATVRRSVLTLCQAVEEGDESSLEIGWPTDVEHVAHVTFDRYNGFLGLPQEFQVEVPGRVPSARAVMPSLMRLALACVFRVHDKLGGLLSDDTENRWVYDCSQSVFGVSAESMQCSYDHNGNSVPTILLLMQERLYHQGGLKAEGIFRINAENSHHEHVRDQLNKGIVPMDIDLHCLAGLIKAWFRELPQGVLDVLSPEQVLDCHTEEESVALVKLLPPTQAALLDWAVNLMADVVQEEDVNKMNARNIAMVFAPNMTQMADPLTALMHAVQVMNLLKTLILRTLKARQDAMLEHAAQSSARLEGDEPDSACSNAVDHDQRHSPDQLPVEDHSVRSTKRGGHSSKAKAKSGNLGCMVESERRKRLSHSLGQFLLYHHRHWSSVPLNRFLKLSRSSSSFSLRKLRMSSRSKSSPQLQLRDPNEAPTHEELVERR